MSKNIKSTIGRNITNARGWRTNRKIVLFESDDWGSIRMPNKSVYYKYNNLGYNVKNNSYCRYDTLANSDDLNALFEVLVSYKDYQGKHPKFTFNTVVGNPHFDKIKDSGYNEYFYEPFLETLHQYYPNENVFNLWRQGIYEGLIIPQFHGREHVNAPVWLHELRMGTSSLLEAFELGFWGIPKHLYGSEKVNIQAAYSSADKFNVEFYKDNIKQGTEIFDRIFGFRSKTFIANNYTFPEEILEPLNDAGIQGIQSMKYHKIPQGNNSLLLKNVYTGIKTNFHQFYTVRNCVFEPAQMQKEFDNVGNCINEISNSFFWKKPAIITSHRLNYIGAIVEKNRTENLKMLDLLLQKILRKWPDVEFMSSNELINLID